MYQVKLKKVVQNCKIVASVIDTDGSESSGQLTLTITGFPSQQKNVNPIPSVWKDVVFDQTPMGGESLCKVHLKVGVGSVVTDGPYLITLCDNLP